MVNQSKLAQGDPPAGSPEWWASGKVGALSPWAAAQVWALIKMSTAHGITMSDNDIASEVTKVGGGHPTKQAILRKPR